MPRLIIDEDAYLGVPPILFAGVNILFEPKIEYLDAITLLFADIFAATDLAVKLVFNFSPPLFSCRMASILISDSLYFFALIDIKKNGKH